MTLTTLPLSEPFGAVAFRESGLAHAGRSAPVVLIHGVGMQSAVWWPQAEKLSETHHVIALDMPGHGGSSPLPRAAELPDFVAWLLSVLDAMSLDRANLVGHSMGALIAGGFAVEHGHRLERVSLLNGVFRRKASARKAVIARAELIRNGSFDTETPLNRWFLDMPEQQAARHKTAAWLSEVDIDGYATAYTAFATGDDIYADRYAGISCPFLAMTGALDQNSTPAMAQDMAATVANGQAIILGGHGHMMTLTAPEEVTAALQSWLGSDLGPHAATRETSYDHT